MQILQPPSWPKPKGYSNGIAANGRFVFVSGMVGWDENCRFAGPDFVSQARKALENIVAVLADAQAKPEHIVRITWYVVDRQEYLNAGKELGAAYRDVIGRHFPAMTAVEVKALIEEQARVEIEATAVVPES
jgi:enamine deaminase RidA (YjgF/YER057c/UK114 family)